MRKKYFYIANWKAYLPYQEAVQWHIKHAVDLKVLAAQEMLIICPDFLALAEVKKNIAPVFVGAQNCSEHDVGAFTGEISVESLKEIGIRYCIVGHSERRRLFGETSEIVARKMALLLHHDIIPVVCVGNAWKEEISSLLDTFSSTQSIVSNYPIGYCIFIAYEPISAIGTGNRASREEIEKTLKNIHEKFTKQVSWITVKMLYGGSVNGNNCAELKKIPLLDGFLIGKASTDFQELKNIVYS